MGNKNNIDRLFQEHFKSFEVAPDDMVWSNIQSKLEEDKESKKTRLIWVKLGGIAVSLLLFMGGVGVFLSDDQSINTVVSTSENELPILSGKDNVIAKENTNGVMVYDERNNVSKIELNKQNLLNDDIIVSIENIGSLLGGRGMLNEVSFSNSTGFSLLKEQKNNELFFKNTSSVVSKNDEQIFSGLLFKKEQELLSITTIVGGEIANSLGLGVDLFGGSTSDDSLLNEKIKVRESIEQVVNNGVVYGSVEFLDEGLGFQKRKEEKSLYEVEKESGKLVNGVSKGLGGESEIVVNNETRTNSNIQIAIEAGLTGLALGNNISSNLENKEEEKLFSKAENEADKIVSIVAKGLGRESKVVVNNQKYSNSEIQITLGIDSVSLALGSDVALEVKTTDDHIPIDLKKDKGVTQEDVNKQPVEKTIEEAVAEMKREDDKEEEENIVLNRWEVTPLIAPVYYNTLSSGSPIDVEFSSNKKKGQLTMSYGVGVGYMVNKRLGIRTGINKVELGYDTQDVAIYSSPETSNDGPGFKNINLASGMSSLNLVSSEGFSVSQIPSSFSLLFDSSLNQRFGYLEVPLELSYKLSDKRMKINLIGGLSTFFLNKNEIFTEVDGNLRYLGEASNLNKISYSGNIGFGFNYKISKAFNFNFEPMFKYQLNAFSNDSGNFRPYILGVYSGFSFKF